MSALVIIECDACVARTDPAIHAVEARTLAELDGWSVAVPGGLGGDVDYCPACTAASRLLRRDIRTGAVT